MFVITAITATTTLIEVKKIKKYIIFLLLKKKIIPSTVTPRKHDYHHHQTHEPACSMKNFIGLSCGFRLGVIAAKAAYNQAIADGKCATQLAIK